MKFIELLYPTTFLLLVLLTGLIALSLLRTGISLQALMQIIASLTLVIIVSTRLFFPKIRARFGPKVAYIIEGIPALVFVYLLILATGGIVSPFLVLTHFLALAIAFLLSPQLAVEFIFATIFLLGTHVYFDTLAQKQLAQNLFVVILYFIAYLALVPISYAVAKEYKFKEEWANLLEKQIATSKTQEEQLLKNIQEAIILINNNFDILYTNQTAQDLFKIGANAINQNFYKIFQIKDKDGRNLFAYSLPFEQTFKSKLPQIVKDIQISGKDQKFTKIDLKIIPAITPQGPLGLVLIIIDKTSKYLQEQKEQSTANAALERFLFFLENQKKVLDKFTQKSTYNLDILSLLKQNEELSHLAQDFIYTLRLESGEVGALSSLFDVGKTLEAIYQDQLWKAKELGLTLTAPQEKKELPIQPRGNLKIKVEKRIFPKFFILGNESWVQDSINRILELCYLTSEKGLTIPILLIKESDLVKINIYCEKPTISPKDSHFLFEKFYANLTNLPGLSQTSGLEGFITQNLLSRMGASIKIEAVKDSPGFSYVITFGANEITTPTTT